MKPLLCMITFMFSLMLFGQTKKTTVKIGNQEWQTTNLNVTKYRNGDPIPQVTDQEEWANLTTGAWCYYNNNPKNGAVYGKLYNWYAVNDPRGLAPQGFHIPTNEEWTILTDFLGGEDVAGGKMKEKGTTHWESPNEAAPTAAVLLLFREVVASTVAPTSTLATAVTGGVLQRTIQQALGTAS